MALTSMALDYKHRNRFEFFQIHQTLELVMRNFALGPHKGCKY